MYEKISFTVSGKVQGVCFRAYTQEAAVDMDLTGWVSNRPDGRVEGQAWGKMESVELFINWLKTKGSPYGRVDKLDVDRIGDHESRPESFQIRY